MIKAEIKNTCSVGSAHSSPGIRNPDLHSFSPRRLSTAAMMAELRAALSETGALVTHSSWRNVELMSHGMGKAAALRWLADHLGLSLQDCMAFGDNANDLDMLGAVGWPVAVGNATEEVKRIARLVADTDANDGVAKVILGQLEDNQS